MIEHIIGLIVVAIAASVKLLHLIRRCIWPVPSVYTFRVPWHLRNDVISAIETLATQYHMAATSLGLSNDGLSYVEQMEWTTKAADLRALVSTLKVAK